MKTVLDEIKDRIGAAVVAAFEKDSYGVKDIKGKHPRLIEMAAVRARTDTALFVEEAPDALVAALIDLPDGSVSLECGDCRLSMQWHGGSIAQREEAVTLALKAMQGATPSLYCLLSGMERAQQAVREIVAPQEEAK